MEQKTLPVLHLAMKSFSLFQSLGTIRISQWEQHLGYFSLNGHAWESTDTTGQFRSATALNNNLLFVIFYTFAPSQDIRAKSTSIKTFGARILHLVNTFQWTLSETFWSYQKVMEGLLLNKGSDKLKQLHMSKWILGIAGNLSQSIWCSQDAILNAQHTLQQNSEVGSHNFYFCNNSGTNNYWRSCNNSTTNGV